ncbi:MAG: LytTR family transcriptional regulator [Bacteroidales bacterium]|nr:LytTR family transcriptional regulator [Bacteroidales bacterium]MBR6310194.1 LytTR family transcriptional regulator [Paludibacteraceae bacterium]
MNFASNSHAEKSGKFLRRENKERMVHALAWIVLICYRQWFTRAFSINEKEQFNAFFMEQKQLLLTTKKEIRVIRLEKIVAIEIADYLCTIHFYDHSTFTCTKSMKEIISLLPNNFCRISRSLIINTKEVQSINIILKQITMNNGEIFECTHRGIKDLKNFLSKSCI